MIEAYWIIPLQLNVTVPQNAVQIYAELFASGNGNEEFWVRPETIPHGEFLLMRPWKYFNTANQFLPSLPSGTTFGDGPFREVRMLVDGQLAGVAFPYDRHLLHVPSEG